MLQIDLNCDLGESYGVYAIGMDEAVLPYLSSANIACGYHAGDPITMHKTVRMAQQYGVGIGAHPGFPDLIGFGRRSMAASPEEVKRDIQYQIGALYAFCRANNTALCHVKPHGALYNMAAKDETLAKAVCEAIYEVDEHLILLAQSGSKMIDAANVAGIRAAQEVFADRAYADDGSLVPRSQAGAVISDEKEAVDRVIHMIKDNSVLSISGKKIAIKPDSICVHGDNAKALAFIQSIRKALEEEHIAIVSLSEKK